MYLIFEQAYLLLPGIKTLWPLHGAVTEEAIDETGDRFMFPVSLRRLKSTVILRLQEEADIGRVKAIQLPDETNLKL